MVLFFKAPLSIIAVNTNINPDQKTIDKLEWLFGNAEHLATSTLEGRFIGPRKEMITPWSTNAVEITQNMGINNIIRIEEFYYQNDGAIDYDPMLQSRYQNLDQDLFTIVRQPEQILFIDNIAEYNAQEGLALSPEEILYLSDLSSNLGRKLTDSEIFGFSQVNSEHCRHKIFNGTFIVDGQEMPLSLFQLIKKTTQLHPNRVVSAYKDNCAFFQGPRILTICPCKTG